MILPSFMAMLVGVAFLIASLVLFIINYKKINIAYVIMILVLISIAISLHALLHFANEVYYNFNPIQKLLHP